jgi:hypothetical protein
VLRVPIRVGLLVVENERSDHSASLGRGGLSV